MAQLDIPDPFQQKSSGLDVPDPFASPAPPPAAAPAIQRPPSSLLRRAVGDTGVDLLRGVVGAGEAVVGLTDIPTLGLSGKSLERIGFDPAKAKEMIGELYSPERKAAQEKVQQAEGFIDTAATMLKNPSTIAGTVVESLPAMLGGGAIGQGLRRVLPRLGTVGAAALGEGAIGAGAAAEGIRQETENRELTPGQAAAAVGSGVGTALLGAGGGALARRLGIADPDVIAAGGDLAGLIRRPGSAVARTARGAAAGAVTEGVFEELPQSVQEQVWQNVALGKPWNEGVPEAAATGLLAGMAMGGPVGAVSAATARQAPEKAPGSLSDAASNIAPPPAIQRPAGALPPPVYRVDTKGRAAPESTWFQRHQMREDKRLAEDAELVRGREELGLTPDVNAARARHPAAAPNAPFPIARPGSLADASNAIAAATGATAAAPANAGMFERILSEQTSARTPRGDETGNAAYEERDVSTGAPAERPKSPPANLDPETGEELGVDEAWPAAPDHLQPQAIVRSLIAEAAQKKNKPAGVTAISARFNVSKDTARALRNRALDTMNAEAGSPRRNDAAAQGVPEQGQAAPAVATAADPTPTSATAPAAGAGQTDTPQTTGPAGQADASPSAVAAGPAQAAPAGALSTPAAQVEAEPPGTPAPAGDTAPGPTLAGPIEETPAAAGPAVAVQAGAQPQATPAAQAQQPAAEAATEPARELTERAHAAATSPLNDRPEPTAAQTEAGNYAKGHVRLHGHDISIENPAGSKRDPKWPALKDHYGYIRGTVGKDKDHVDVFLTENAHDPERPVFVVDQVNKDGGFDEHKVVMGAANEAEAREAYLRNYSKGWTGLGAITQMTQDEFKEWVRNPKNTRRPAARLPDRRRADNGPTVVPPPRLPAHSRSEALRDLRSAVQGSSRPVAGVVWRWAAPGRWTDGERIVTNEVLADAIVARRDPDTLDAIEGEATRIDTKAAPARGRVIEGDSRRVEPAEGAAPARRATAPEHERAPQTGLSVPELEEMARVWRERIDEGAFAAVTRVFDAPKPDDRVRLQDKVRVYTKEHGWMTPAEARAQIDEWRKHAQAQGENPSTAVANSRKVVLSLFDLTGSWSRPWEEAGYQVYRFDIQDESTYIDPETGEERKVGDVHNMSVEFFADLFGDFDGNDIHAILAACPCTDFAVSGARHFAAKDADGRTVSSVELVAKTLAVIEYFKPAVWAIENPVGRIEKLTGLPPWRLSFDPNHLGDPYTKKTLLWGRFNGDLPIAPVEPTEGSKMHRMFGGKSLRTKNARSATPEGFAYGFFMANNAIDHPAMTLANIYDRLDASLIERALDAGVSEQAIRDAVDDPYYRELDDKAATAALRKLIADAKPARAPRQRAGASPAPAPAAAPELELDPRFANNTVFTADRVAAAKARLRAKLGTLNSGLDPELLLDGITIAGGHIEAGARKFADYAQAMIEDLGEAVKPYLLSFYEAVRHYPGAVKEGMDDAAVAAEAFDALLKPADLQADAIGQAKPAPKRRAAAKVSGGERRLRDDWGTDHITGYPEPGGGREEGNTTKDAFLKDARDYLKAVADELEEAGFTATLDRRGRPVKAVHVNASGAAGSGDVILHMLAPNGTGVYVTIGGTSLRGVVPTTTSGIAVMYRTTDGTYQHSGQNRWARTDLTAAELAATLRDLVERSPFQGAASKGPLPGAQADERAGTAPETADNRAPEASDAAALQPQRVPAEGRRGAESRDAAGGRNRKPVDAGVAGGREAAPGQPGLFAGPAEAGERGTRGAGAGGGDAAPGPARSDAGARTESGSADAATDFDLTGEELGRGGLASKYRDNIAAIRIVKAMAAESRPATAEERKQIARYVGWGALKGVFDPANKQWAKQYAELKELLTPEEYAAARASTRNAHFTSQEVVKPMLAGLQRLGFTRGRLLEPSMGTGNFFGMMPASLRSTAELYGVELDPLTSKIAAALYPSARVTNSGFEAYNVPGGFFDAAIGNPPFGEETIVDGDRSPYSGFSIHNYFLAKTIDKLRPGGVAMMVVSHNFLDAKDSRARAWIADRASLVSAVRLPNTAFKGNAGTEVVTDILVFQKHDKNGLPADDRAWVQVGEQTNENPKTGETAKHQVNRYFLDNPQQVLGQPSAGGSMYRANEYTVTPTGELGAQLDAWVAGLPQGIYTPIDRTEAMQSAEVPEGTKVGNFFLDASGAIRQRGEDVAGATTAKAWEPSNAKAEGRMRGMIRLRNLLRRQMVLERDPAASDDAVEANRKKLNEAYDQFQKEHGYLNAPVNRRLFLDDSDADLVQALEFDYDPGISKTVAEREGIPQRAPSATKADIFARRVAFPQNDMQHVESAKDALVASLNYRGQVNLAYMESITGKDADELLSELGELVYRTPDGSVQTADEYLSGDVKTKLAEAQAAAAGDPAFKRNVEALRKVIPRDKTPSEVHVSLGAHFVPNRVMEDFFEHITGGRPTMAFVRALGRWLVDGPRQTDQVRMQSTWGTSDMTALQLLHATIDGRAVVVTETIRHGDGRTTTIVKEAETEAAREKQNAIRQEWKSWLWRDPERAELVLGEYNEKMNRVVARKYDGSHLTLPGKNPAITLLKHQLDGIWRGLQSRQILLDHVVGAGKTFQIIGMLMEMRRLGIARKPVLAVPNHLTLQWRSEFTRLYPGSRVLAATPEDFSKENRPKLFSKIVTGDWDAVILGHSSLKKIGLPPETEAAIIKEQVDELASAIEEMKRGRGDRNIIRDMEGIKRNLDSKMKAKLAEAGPRDKVLTFDELGLDALGIDELHEFKNLAYSSTMTRVPGMGNPKGSARAFDLFLKTQWLFKTFGDKAPLITATGTPVSNSLVEMFNVQRFMQYPRLHSQGLHLFDAWARAYGSVESVYEVAPSGSGFRSSSRFAKFQNLSSLMSDYMSFADIVTLDDLKRQEEAAGKRFPVPRVRGGKPTLVVAPRSPAVASLMGVPTLARTEDGAPKFRLDLRRGDTYTITENETGRHVLTVTKAGATRGEHFGSFETADEARAAAVEAALTPEIQLDPESILGRFANLRELTRSTKGKVNALSLTGEANKAGLDYRLIDPAAPDFPDSKVNRAVANILAEYRRWEDDKGTQLVFCDMSVPLSARSAMAAKPKRAYVRDTDGSVIHKRATLHTIEGAEELPFFVVEARAKSKDRPAEFAVYDAATGFLMRDGLGARAAARDWAAGELGTEDGRQRWIDTRGQTPELTQEDIDEYNDANEIDTAESEGFSLQDVAGASAAAGFSVYDDMKAKLVAAGVPEREIAFIHDYDTPTAKAKLFAQVNAGDVRILFGSTPKMGAGTNVQKRAVALHHIDAPWKPSDLEQREGRVIRRGNMLYDRDPDGFEVGIYRYATEQTYDARRWQILEHKARGIEQLRNYDGTLNEIEDIDGEAANAADMKAAASGDPLILRETQLRNEVRRLENLEVAHADNAVAAQRAARQHRERAQERLPDRAAKVDALLARVKPDSKDGVPAGSSVAGQTFTDRKELTKEIARRMGSYAQEVHAGIPKGPWTLSWRGIEFTVTAQGRDVRVGNEVDAVLYLSPGDTFSASGLVTRMNNHVDRLRARREQIEHEIAESAAAAERFAEEAVKPFPDAELLTQTRREYRAVQRALLLKGPNLKQTDRKDLDDATKLQHEALREAGLGDALDELMAANEDTVETGALVREDGASYGETRPLPDRQERGGVASPRGPEAAAGAPAAVQGELELFLPAERPRRKRAPRAAYGAPRLAQSARLVRTGEFRTGIERVVTLEDAAHIMAPLRKSAQERFMVLALDREGRPLGVFQHSLGTVDGANVDPGIVLGAVAGLKGIRSVVVAHNHPSGNLSPSNADYAVDARLLELFNGSGIDIMGSIIVAPASRMFTIYGRDGARANVQATIPTARRRGSVPQLERVLRKVQPSGGRQQVTSPDISIRLATKHRTESKAGVLLLNTRHELIGFMPFDAAKTKKLRTGKVETSHAGILAAVSESNAAAAIVYADAANEQGLANMVAALRAADTRVLDGILFDGDAATSLASRGRVPHGAILYSLAEADADTNDTFFSPLLRAVETAKGAPRRAGAKAWKQWLDGAQRRGELKQEERDWLDVDAWLEGQESVTREALADYIRANQVQVHDVLLGPAAGAAQSPEPDERPSAGFDGVVGYDRYQTPGGTNYRELLLTLGQEVDQYSGEIRVPDTEPDRDEVVDDLLAAMARSGTEGLDFGRTGDPGVIRFTNYTADQLQKMTVAVLEEGARKAWISSVSSRSGKPAFISGHFKTYPNVLAHVRFNERLAEDGKRVLFIEEIQSDWHQAGRRRGYGQKPRFEVRNERNRIVAGYNSREQAEEKARELGAGHTVRFAGEVGIPNAPFKTSWPMLAFKRMLRYAADHGFERVAWTTGEQQIDRYDLRKRIGAVAVRALADGDFAIRLFGPRGGDVPGYSTFRRFKAEALPDFLGKELADKIIAGEGGTVVNGTRFYRGVDLRVGGEGMVGFYDRLLPTEVGKLVRRFGAKVGRTAVLLNGAAGHRPLAEQAKFDAHSVDVTPELRRAALGGQPLFSGAGGGAGNAPLSFDRALRLKAELTGQWGKNAPTVTLVRSAEDFPPWAKADPSYRRAEGVWGGRKTIWLNVGAIATEKRFAQVLAHEAIGHYGIEAIVGPQDWTGIIGAINNHARAGTGAPSLQRAIRDVRRRYGELDPETFAKEVIAVMAEQGARNGLLRRVVAAVRAFLRRIMPSLPWSEADVVALLAEAESYLRAGTSQAKARAAAAGATFSVRELTEADREAQTRARRQLRGVTKHHTAAEIDAAIAAQEAVKVRLRDLRPIEKPSAAEAPDFQTAQTVAEFWRALTAGEGIHEYGLPAPGVRDLQAIADAVTEGHGRYVFSRRGMIPGQGMQYGIQTPAGRTGTLELREDGSLQLHIGGLTQGEGEGRAIYMIVNTWAARNGYRALPDDAGLTPVNAYRRTEMMASSALRDGGTAHLMPAPQQRMPHWREGDFGRPPSEAEQRFNTGYLFIKGAAQALNTVPLLDRVRFNFDTGRFEDTKGREFTDADFDALLTQLPAGKAGVGRRTAKRAVLTASALQQLAGQPLAAGRAAGQRLLDAAPRVGPDLRGEDGAAPGLLAPGPLQGALYSLREGQEPRLETDARGRRTIHVGDAAFREVASRFYLMDRAGRVRDFRDLDAATAEAERLRAQVRADDPIDGEPQTYSVVLPEAIERAAGVRRPLFSKAPEEVLADIEAVMAGTHREGLLERAKQWLKDATPRKIKDELRGTWLGALTTRHLTELGADYFDNIRHYSEFLARQQADQNALAAEAEAIAETARKWAGKNRAEARRLFDLMHRATIDGIDPAKDYEPLSFEYGGVRYEATKKNVRDALRALREQMLGRGGDNKKDLMAEAKRIRALPGRERRRREKYPDLVAEWNALSPEAKDVYVQFRDAYAKRSEQVEAALVGRINDTDAPENRKRKLINTIRMQFESARLEGVYFPLQRFGRYFVAAEKDGTSTFLMFERLGELERAVKDLRARGFTIVAQGRKGAGKAKDAPSGTFVAEVIEQLRKAGVSTQTQDQIYQLYLESLPELSMRKHSIHRKAVPGFDPDAVRAFAFNMHHGSHQLARLRWAHKRQNVLELLRQQQDAKRKEDGADTRKVAAADAILDELARREDWINNPQDSQATNLVSSFGFAYYLGLTPAAALVNLTQTAMVSYPWLAARFGHRKAMNELLRGVAASGRTVGNIQNALTDPEERRAHAVLQQMGAIDKTQAHNLAGIAEGGLTGYNPKWAKAMEIIGWAFHKAEVINRESTGMATFRLARAEGKSFEEAVRLAADAIYDTHFDYSNANRARFMQSGAAKVLLMFRQYSLNMTWHLARMAWQATKGAEPEVRALARRNLAGVLGMAGIFAGVLGLPMVKLTMSVLNAVAASAGDDDEPWDAETEFRAWLAGLVGASTAEAILTGPTNALTGADIHARVSLSELWIRDADRELDGRGAYYHLLEQAAGPMGGVLKNALVGKGMIDEGHVWRGIETMLPKALKDMLKAARYSLEGVNNLRGDPVLEDPTLWQALMQLQGFTPSTVAEKYQRNRSLKNYEQHILDRRQHLMNSLAMAYRLGDQEARAETMRAIEKFNRTHPEIGITAATIRRSMAQRARYSARAEDGIVLNPRLAAKVRAQVGAD